MFLEIDTGRFHIRGVIPELRNPERASPVFWCEKIERIDRPEARRGIGVEIIKIHADERGVLDLRPGHEMGHEGSVDSEGQVCDRVDVRITLIAKLRSPILRLEG